MRTVSLAAECSRTSRRVAVSRLARPLYMSAGRALSHASQESELLWGRRARGGGGASPVLGKGSGRPSPRQPSGLGLRTPGHGPVPPRAHDQCTIMRRRRSGAPTRFTHARRGAGSSCESKDPTAVKRRGPCSPRPRKDGRKLRRRPHSIACLLCGNSCETADCRRSASSCCLPCWNACSAASPSSFAPARKSSRTYRTA